MLLSDTEGPIDEGLKMGRSRAEDYDRSIDGGPETGRGKVEDYEGNDVSYTHSGSEEGPNRRRRAWDT